MKKKKDLKKIPSFKDEAEEREFWQNHDSSDYVDWSKAKEVKFPNLKPTNAKDITKKLNEVCSQQDTSLDPALEQLQALSLHKEDWPSDK